MVITMPNNEDRDGEPLLGSIYDEAQTWLAADEARNQIDRDKIAEQVRQHLRPTVNCRCKPVNVFTVSNADDGLGFAALRKARIPNPLDGLEAAVANWQNPPRFGTKIHEFFEAASKSIQEARRGGAHMSEDNLPGPPFYGLSLTSSTPPEGRQREFRISRTNHKGETEDLGHAYGRAQLNQLLAQMADDALSAIDDAETKSINARNRAEEFRLKAEKFDRRAEFYTQQRAAIHEIATSGRLLLDGDEKPVFPPEPTDPTNSEAPVIVYFEKQFANPAGKRYVYSAIRDVDGKWGVTGRGNFPGTSSSKISWQQLMEFVIWNEAGTGTPGIRHAQRADLRHKSIASLRIVSPDGLVPLAVRGATYTNMFPERDA